MEQVEARGIVLSEEVVEDLRVVLPDVIATIRAKADELALGAKRLSDEVDDLYVDRGDLERYIEALENLRRKADA